MRRVLLFAAFLLLLGLTTATAASFDVQAEDITSFSTSTTLTVPAPPPPAAGTYYLVNAPANANLVTLKPTSNTGNEKASFTFGPSDVETEERALQSGDKAAYVAWRSSSISTGMTFVNRTVRVEFTRTAATSGELVLGLFSCDQNAHLPTVSGNGCRLLSKSLPSNQEIIDIVVTNAQVDPGDELRLKMVSSTTASSSVQWGFKEPNRAALLEIQP